jgi:hypothetical protein
MELSARLTVLAAHSPPDGKLLFDYQFAFAADRFGPSFATSKELTLKPWLAKLARQLREGEWLVRTRHFRWN